MLIPAAQAQFARIERAKAAKELQRATDRQKAKVRARRWQIAKVAEHLCPLCANPAARLCKNKACRKFRKPVAHEQCSACHEPTEAMRLCLVHLASDRARKAAA